MLENVNLLAVIVAAIAAMPIGAAWYGALAKAWMDATGFTKEERAQVEKGGNPLIYALAALCHLVIAYMLAGVIFHSGGYSLGNGVLSAFLIWLGFVLTTMSVNHRFQMKSWKLTAIDGGHFLATMLVQGALIGWWGV